MKDIYIKLTKKCEKLILLSFALIFIMCIVITGSYLNFQTMSSNGCKMPVKSFFIYADSEHFSYADNAEIIYPNLSDIYPIGNYIYSIGDIIMFIGGGLFIVVGIFMIINIFQFTKMKRKMRLK